MEEGKIDSEEDEGVRILADALASRFPDPVDVFEDRLASRLGLFRHPALTPEEWRRLRALVIEGDEDE